MTETSTAVISLFEEHRPWAIGVGRRVARRRRWLARQFFKDQLDNASLIGLFNACIRYSPERGRFKSFAVWRIRGAVEDEFRGLGFFDGRTANSRPVRLDATPDSPHSGEIPDSRMQGEPIQAAISAEVLALLSICSDLQQHVLYLHFFEHQSLREVGQRLGVSESRICQIVREALGRIRAACN